MIHLEPSLESMFTIVIVTGAAVAGEIYLGKIGTGKSTT